MNNVNEPGSSATDEIYSIEEREFHGKSVVIQMDQKNYGYDQRFQQASTSVVGQVEQQNYGCDQRFQHASTSAFAPVEQKNYGYDQLFQRTNSYINHGNYVSANVNGFQFNRPICAWSVQLFNRYPQTSSLNYYTQLDLEDKSKSAGEKKRVLQTNSFTVPQFEIFGNNCDLDGLSDISMPRLSPNDSAESQFSVSQLISESHCGSSLESIRDGSLSLSSVRPETNNMHVEGVHNAFKDNSQSDAVSEENKSAFASQKSTRSVRFKSMTRTSANNNINQNINEPSSSSTALNEATPLVKSNAIVSYNSNGNFNSNYSMAGSQSDSSMFQLDTGHAGSRPTLTLGKKPSNLLHENNTISKDLKLLQENLSGGLGLDSSEYSDYANSIGSDGGLSLTNANRISKHVEDEMEAEFRSLVADIPIEDWDLEEEDDEGEWWEENGEGEWWEEAGDEEGEWWEEWEEGQTAESWSEYESVKSRKKKKKAELLRILYTSSRFGGNYDPDRAYKTWLEKKVEKELDKIRNRKAQLKTIPVFSLHIGILNVKYNAVIKKKKNPYTSEKLEPVVTLDMVIEQFSTHFQLVKVLQAEQKFSSSTATVSQQTMSNASQSVSLQQNLSQTLPPMNSESMSNSTNDPATTLMPPVQQHMGLAENENFTVGRVLEQSISPSSLPTDSDGDKIRMDWSGVDKLLNISLQAYAPGTTDTEKEKLLELLRTKNLKESYFQGYAPELIAHWSEYKHLVALMQAEEDEDILDRFLQYLEPNVVDEYGNDDSEAGPESSAWCCFNSRASNGDAIAKKKKEKKENNFGFIHLKKSMLHKFVSQAEKCEKESPIMGKSTKRKIYERKISMFQKFYERFMADKEICQTIEDYKDAVDSNHEIEPNHGTLILVTSFL